MRNLRVVVCQVECHPAVYTHEVALLEEPFVPEDISLTSLAMRGLQTDTLQATCQKEYLRWQQLRLESILHSLEDLDPLPDLVIFPECSVPMTSLPSICKWSASTGANILAGSHTPLLTADAKAIYREIGLRDRRVAQLGAASVRQVLPLVRSGKVSFIRKRLLSPFERSSTSNTPEPYVSIDSATVDYRGGTLDVLPLICSEALQNPNTGGQPELVAIISYDRKPSQFSPYCIQQVANRRVVAYCNDGRYGGSNILTIRDARTPDWFREALPEGLPPGDGILVADVDLDVKAIEVGTAVPSTPIRWFRLASVVAENSSEGDVAQALKLARKLPEPAARASELRSLLSRAKPSEFQSIRIKHLVEVESRGIPAEDLWNTISTDVVVPHLETLRDLESRLTGIAQTELAKLFVSPAARNPETAQQLVQYIA
jgi:hypothetical protein